MKPQIVVQQSPDLSDLKAYVEEGVELPKVELVHRVAGKVEYGLFTYLKSLVFHHAEKHGERVVLV